MAEPNLSGRLVEIESMLDRSRRRFEEGTRLVEEAHKLLADIQQAIIGSPRSVSPEDSEEAASKLLASLKATGGARLKSGGTISGALRATVNSAFGLRRLRNAAQPLVATSATRTSAVRLLRMFDSLLRPGAFRVVLTSDERTQQQDHDRDANRRIADIED